MSTTYEPTARTLAILRAVAAGRVQLTRGSEPDLFVDGMACCDQFTAHLLVHDGLIAPAPWPEAAASLVPAVLTEAGSAVLTAARQAA
ncbi:hypothetical protein [Amycolatopsis cihanbeyliensis]|uniref:Uncharacterized protein n=1 Tax=Amycolatopsis cihanbeyliensis TaxID=1128664 RepID=A0A542CUC9_AMYCI|nr:hypothetical protein [Amycolatopsis cihanbeyliensis]TQI94436.1 hypothetical protein FB471_6601 [Amycolatopsis cihanbeyliensis]